ncbi:MAG: hypothetical protein KAV87_02275 [Desulfobacteraceae bacterium]|nr:hypothetical protein [Desulfobacteraceae bacterium]
MRKLARRFFGFGLDKGFILPVLISTIFHSIPVSADPLFDMLVEQARNDPTTLISLNEYGSFIQATSGPFSLPGISSATFQVARGKQRGDGEFLRVVLPFSHSFESLEFGGLTPYSEVTFSYTNQKQNEWWLVGTPYKMLVRHELETYSILGGFGFDFKLLEGFIIRPFVHLGWSRIRDNSYPTTVAGEDFRAAVGEGLFVWEVDQLLYGPALEAEYTTIVGNDIKIVTSLRATKLRLETIETNTPGLEESGKIQTVSGNLELDGPTSMTIYDRNVRWQYFIGAVQFDDSTSNVLGFSWLREMGVGLSLVDSQQDLPYIEALAIRGSVITGDNNVSGWTIGLDATF